MSFKKKCSKCKIDNLNLYKNRKIKKKLKTL